MIKSVFIHTDTAVALRIKGWGENGHVRVYRQPHGSKGIPGVCGIARSPSVALGGYLLTDRQGFAGFSATRSSEVENFQYTALENICSFLHLRLDGPCGKVADWTDNNHALVLGALGLILSLLAVWPLSRDWRNRRRRRRERQRRGRTSLSPGRQGSGLENPPTETTPLVNANTK